MSDSETTRSTKPEPSPDATVRMVAGVPENPHQTQPLNRAKYVNADGTLKLSVADLAHRYDPAEEKALTLYEPPVRQPVPESAGETQKQAQRPELQKPMAWKLPVALTLGALVVLGVTAFLWFGRGPAPLPPSFLAAAAPAESVPQAARVYLEQAKAGDARAMRMLGVMYYNGLDVPRDREKGIHWYRMAAKKGSDAARKELSQLEGGR